MRQVLLLSTMLLGALADDDSNRTYSSLEKERFIYGKPGDRDYGKPRTASDIMRLERMWAIDSGVQQFRGFI